MKKRKRKKPPTILREALADTASLGKDQPSQKNKAIIFRVSASEKEEIRQVAIHLDLSVSAYLLHLHRIAQGKLGQ